MASLERELEHCFKHGLSPERSWNAVAWERYFSGGSLSNAPSSAQAVLKHSVISHAVAVLQRAAAAAMPAGVGLIRGCSPRTDRLELGQPAKLSQSTA